jgi:iron(III) transport system ATP-binding protein
MTNAFLDLQHLTKIFTARGAVRAVDDASIAIDKGELVTLLGPSGCGKTTTLRMIAGFELPDEGQIVLDERDITSVPPNRRDTAMVFQSYAIFPHLTVDENIAYGLRVKRMPSAEVRRRVDAIAEVAGLEGLLRRQPNQLSGGQQQRVALARALVMEPKVLLFDEPLSNLDAKLRVQMREQIRSLQQRFGITAVYVTHDQAEAMALSDRIVVMNQGKVEQIASPTEIYLHPATPFVAEFIGQANFLPGRLESVQSGTARVSALGQVVEAEIQAGTGYASGESVTLVIRPEWLNMSANGAAGAGVPGEVRRAVFLGSVAEYDVQVAEGTTLTVTLHGTRARQPHQVGQQVTLELLDGAAFVLPLAATKP